MHEKPKLVAGIGLFFLVWGLFAIAKSIYFHNYEQLLWACWIGFILIGIGILTRNAFLVMSQLAILAIPWIAWTIDFAYRASSNQTLWGITNYFFESQLTIDKVVTSAHLIALPLALIALGHLAIHRNDAWKLSLVQVATLFILTTLFSASKEANINCVAHACIPLPETLPYRFLWIMGAIIMIVGTNYLVLWLFKKKERNL